jgi:hypothetical protein
MAGPDWFQHRNLIKTRLRRFTGHTSAVTAPTLSFIGDEIAGALHTMSTVMDDAPEQVRDSIQVDALHLLRLFLSVKAKDDRAELLKIVERIVETLERRH